MAMNAHGVELDVHVTADGVPIVHHDPAVASHPIQHTLFDTVQGLRLSNGETVPTLADALRVLASDIKVYVEVKALAEAHDQAVLDALAAGPAPEHYQVHSFDHRIVRRLRQIDPDLKCGVLSCSYPLRPFMPLLDAGAGVLWQQESLVDEALVTEGHALGLQLFAWTADEPSRMQALLDMGVDGICTNRPDVGREVAG